MFWSLSYGVLGQVWYFIVWIPDLCLYIRCMQVQGGFRTHLGNVLGTKVIALQRMFVVYLHFATQAKLKSIELRFMQTNVFYFIFK